MYTGVRIPLRLDFEELSMNRSIVVPDTLAKVTITAFLRHQIEKPDSVLVTETFEMTTDLPAAKMGEAICSVINTLWKHGYDPTKTKLEIDFS
jgi:hypothetical protein